MNYMWWLQEKRPIKANVVNTYIYNNMVAEFKRCKPIISLHPYWVQGNTHYYYNSIPYLPKEYEVVFTPHIPQADNGCNFSFDPKIKELNALSGKFGYSFEIEDTQTHQHIHINIIYDDNTQLVQHVQFLLACIATDYTQKMTDDRLAIHKEILKLASHPGYLPKNRGLNLNAFFTPKNRPLTKDYAYGLKRQKERKQLIKARIRRDENGRFLPTKNRNK